MLVIIELFIINAIINSTVKIIYENICFCSLSFFLSIGTFSVSAGAYSFIMIIQNDHIINAVTYFIVPVNTTYFPINAVPLYRISV